MIVKHNIICVLFFLFSNITLTQTIKGVVKDLDQNLLFGATAYNSTNGKSTITNEEGEFSIASTKGENKLVISYVGHTPKVINVDENTFYDAKGKTPKGNPCVIEMKFRRSCHFGDT